MLWRNIDTHYGIITKTLHWLMAVLVIGMLAVGIYMSDLKLSPDKLKLYGLHKSFGIAVLGLVTIRLIWRFTNTSPLLPDHMKPIERLLAHAGHYGLYALMFFMPLSGWLMSSAAGFPVSFFGLFTLPDFIAKSHDMKETLEEVHEVGALALMILIGLHFLAALLHHFYHKDNVLRRMLPLLLLAVLLPSATLANIALTVIPEKSSIRFTATQNNAPVEGTFKNFTANITFHPEHLAESTANATIDMASVSTTYEDISTTLQNPAWFAAEQFPHATFTADKFTHIEGNIYQAAGKLTIKGITHPVIVDFTLVQFADGIAHIIGDTELMRTDFTVGDGEWNDTSSVKDSVRVDIELYTTF